MKIECVWEHNGSDTLLYAANLPGAYTRSASIEGSRCEFWSLRKMLRRFIWHDRIHTKAMYRMAIKAFGKAAIPNAYYFAE